LQALEPAGAQDKADLGAVYRAGRLAPAIVLLQKQASSAPAFAAPFPR
jgi:hypothetical protein